MIAYIFQYADKNDDILEVIAFKSKYTPPLFIGRIRLFLFIGRICLLYL